MSELSLQYSDDEDAQIKLPQPKDVDKIYNSIEPANISQEDETYFDNHPVEDIIEKFRKDFITSVGYIYLNTKLFVGIKTANNCLDYISESLVFLKKNIEELVVDFNERIEIKRRNLTWDRVKAPSEEYFNQNIELDSRLISGYKKYQILFKKLDERLQSASRTSIVSPSSIEPIQSMDLPLVVSNKKARETTLTGNTTTTDSKVDNSSTSNATPTGGSAENTRQITLKEGKIITITDFKLITDGASGVIDGKRFTVTRTSGMAGGKRGVKKSRKRKPSRRLYH
uniref:Uncharacterized protein n=1 Tax=viral metagenome TaxID=1070528 RepID=A0A6C0JMC7_9ZZZZ